MLQGQLTEEQAKQVADLGPEAVCLALLAANARLAQLGPSEASASASPSPSTPSGMIPVYQKPATPRRRRKPGAKEGHAGTRRKTPEKIDEKVEHRLEVCPCCAGPLQRCKRTRTRIIEDIPKQIEPVVTEHTIHRDYCPNCKKHVEPVVPDAMPNATLGHNVIGLTSWLHYGLGVTISQVREILGSQLQTEITAGGLIDGWQRLSAALIPWYEQIADQAHSGAVLHADETGWRVNGQTHWLWCFCNPSCCYYLIDRSRGASALQKFFTDTFHGTLITDFWRPYDNIWSGDTQKCLGHLLRELVKVDERNNSGQWRAFSKQLKRLIRDGLRLYKRPDFSTERYARRIGLLNNRLWKLANAVYVDADTVRLGERLYRYYDYLFTFLDTPGVTPDNNRAERMIRPAVVIRKNSLCNRSTNGAETQAILMSIYRTLKLRGLDATSTIAEALKTYLQTGKLPDLPAGAASG